MYLQHQLLDEAKLHLPGDVSHLIYHTPVSGTASSDGQLCPVCPVLLFIIPCYTSITSKLNLATAEKTGSLSYPFGIRTPGDVLSKK